MWRSSIWNQFFKIVCIYLLLFYGLNSFSDVFANISTGFVRAVTCSYSLRFFPVCSFLVVFVSSFYVIAKVLNSEYNQSHLGGFKKVLMHHRPIKSKPLLLRHVSSKLTSWFSVQIRRTPWMSLCLCLSTED